ncbi:MAG: MMPL family transporter [Nitrospinae bacterium]|nr:MMPL family transporter [Nitrospinota bacterium]
MFRKITDFSIKRPKLILTIAALMVVLTLSQFYKVKMDTDPENMLPHTAPVRVAHEAMKIEFALYDMIVVGVVNNKHPEGVFNVKSLGAIYNITEEIKKLDGVIAEEIISPSTKDNVEQAGIGAVHFNWLMPEPPKTEEEALHIRSEAEDNPMFKGLLVSEDGKAMAIYVPIRQKDISYEVTLEIKKIVERYKGDEEFHYTGLPVANDQFGTEMFKQMAISAPLAGLVIFILMWVFFKSIELIIAPMLVAMVTVIVTMGLLIGFGFPVHIMSSMIPIFLMPISVLDSIHIMSEFYDRYPDFNDKGKTISFVMKELFTPMLYTSLTSAVGFFSLSFSPIPPVQVFGVFVAFGVMLAWVLTITFIPAYIMVVNFGKFERSRLKNQEEGAFILNKVLHWLKVASIKHAKMVFAATILLVVVSGYGISHIQVNDNPVRWFNKDHSIRVADRVLNEHFAGTYGAYLVVEAKDKTAEAFIHPEMLTYVEGLQESMMASGLVGKTTSLADMVKKVYYELLGGDRINNVIPETKAAIAQSIISLENSHKPDDLWHLTTPDYSKVNIWLQLKSGDNKDMSKVVEYVEDYMATHPAPMEISHQWAGLTYINVVWQHNMVTGMIKNFLGSWIIVLFMMLFLFKSPVKALISMIPLTVTILVIYATLGFIGKDYDMPVAILSALTLGLSIDFAIHFIERSVEIYKEKQDWQATADEMFKGPGRAIIRNALVVSIGFLPLLAAPLVPYNTVGFFMFAIMAVSGLATLLLLPAVLATWPDLLLKLDSSAGCNKGHCMLTWSFVAVVAAYLLLGYTNVGLQTVIYVVIGILVASVPLCYLSANRKGCA